jgi:hypothetical protein
MNYDDGDESHSSHTFGKYIFFQHLSHNTPLPFSTRIHLLSSMSLEHRMHLNTFSWCLPSPLVVDSWEDLSFLKLSGELPPIAPEIVPPRRAMIPPIVDDSRCAIAVKERIGGFDTRGKGEEGEPGDSGVSVDVGDRKSAASAVSRPFSVKTCSVGGRSSEYVDETDGLRCSWRDVRPTPRARSASSSDSSLWAYASPTSDPSSSEA